MKFAVPQTQNTSIKPKLAAPYRITLLTLVISAMSSGLALAALPVNAAEQNGSESTLILYSIAPGPLASTLNEFASTAGITLTFDPAQVRGLNSNGLHGRYSVSNALHMLLANTGLQANRTASGAYILVPGVSRALPTVNVRAEAVSTSTEKTLSYDREQLDKINPQDIKDVFKREASVAVGGSITANQKVYVRGIEETAMAVSIDGARQNNKVFHHNATNLIDPALLKTVRASAGVSPADDGPGALGGSLVYETIDVADVLHADETLGGFADLAYQTNGEIFGAKGALMAQTNGFEFLAYANKLHGGDYEDGDSNKVHFTEPALTSVLLKAAYSSADIGRFEISHDRTEDDSARPYRANLMSVRGRPVPESRRYDLERETTVFEYSRDTGQGLFNPSILISDSATRVVTTEVPLSPNDQIIINNGGTSSTSAKLKNVFHTSFAHISAGVDYYDDTAKFREEINPEFMQEKAENIGIFTQVRHEVAKYLDLSYGVRYDDQKFTGTDGSRFDEQGASANLSTDLHLGQYVSVNAAFAKVWGGVALAENYILNDAWDYSRAILPVESDNYSVGIKSHYNGFILEGNLFETDIQNGRVPSWREGGDLVADFLIEGFDVLFGYISQRGEITLGYADIESKKDGKAATSYDGNYFTAPLGRLITLNAELNFHDTKVQLGLNGEKALKNKKIEKEGRAQRGYLVLNAYANYQLTEQLRLRVFADNLTDRAYADRATYGQEFVDVVPIYEPGRSVGISLRYQF